MRNDRCEQKVCEHLGLSGAATQIASGLTRAPIRFSRRRQDWPDGRPSKREPREDAYAIHISLRAAGPCETWINGRKFGPDTIPKGATTLLTLDSGLSTCCHSAYDFMRIHIPRLAIDELADDAGLPRPSHLRAPFFKVVLDSVLFQFATAALSALEQPAEASSLFLDHIALATLAHVHRTYLGSSTETPQLHGGLAPWQERRAKEAMSASLDRDISIAQLASECGLSCSHFARGFRKATGLPPHRWLLERRVETAQGLLLNSPMSLREIAKTCGFSDQSHLTRAFARMVGTSPGAWRRTRRG
jgi:AraC family transcriptional regulator